MDALKSLIQPLVGGAGGSSVVDGMKLVVLGGTVETARRVSSSAWSVLSSPPHSTLTQLSPRSHFVNSTPGLMLDQSAWRILCAISYITSIVPPALPRVHQLTPRISPLAFFLTAHFSEEDYPYDWLMLWLSRRPEWQRSREFETTTRTSGLGADTANSFGEEDFAEDGMGSVAAQDDDDDVPGKVTTRVVFQPTFDTTHTIYYRGHWLRVRRGRKPDGTELLSISVVARSNTILKQLVLQAKKEYEAEAIHRIQIYFADSHGSWRWTDSRHKRPMGSIVLNPGVKEMLLNDTKDFLKSEKWYADRGIPFRRGYLLHGVPGSGKSSLIHAIAGQLMLDIYVVSLSASWISDSTLTTLMGRVPARCILLLEDLDAAFVRSSTREGGNEEKEKKEGADQQNNGSSNNNGSSGMRSGRRGRDQMSDVNTLSLSGLLNALDGVAAAEGRLLFATTNHLDRLDPALSRPGRMDVWVEFKNASKWQAEALFRNFFPCVEDDLTDVEVDGVPPTPSVPTSQGSNSNPGSRPASTLWSMSPSFSSSSVASSFSSTPLSSPTPSSPTRGSTPLFPTSPTAMTPTPLPQFGATNQAYMPPPVEEHILTSQHSAKPLDAITLGILAKKFADGVPEEEFSVAALQGYLLKNKSQPESAANSVGEWVIAEREMRERLKREKAEREEKEKIEREKRKQKAAEKEAEKKELEKKEQELEKMRQLLAEKDKEEKERQEKAKDSEKEKADEKTAAAAAAEASVQEEIRKKEAEIAEARQKQQEQEESDSEDSELENIPIQATTKSTSGWD
ncbi:hypothetical protein H0H81_000655 [Sphagnurus paluster]|uniref:P-loop containing nucleoside triphosphate hydrolase protein n=1 Tax=Sphagnurus paluster TaxID=117069 RepID=A0A9P7K822_9AGAR|nr:hypothetical protein H0H81_000655 [Sphagnurus paluster]